MMGRERQPEDAMRCRRWRERLRAMTHRIRVGTRRRARVRQQVQPRAGVTVLTLSYPTSADVRPRYGYGRPSHARLEHVLARGENSYRAELERLVEYAPDLAVITRDE